MAKRGVMTWDRLQKEAERSAQWAAFVASLEKRVAGCSDPEEAFGALRLVAAEVREEPSVLKDGMKGRKLLLIGDLMGMAADALSR